jgi:hypothetical protein
MRKAIYPRLRSRKKGPLQSRLLSFENPPPDAGFNDVDFLSVRDFHSNAMQHPILQEY